ncbi:hypothetical protein BDN67DRAFT_972518 [Paxillus ammoniavirescens]|nr:hypothetical protein BDN67DRAFT_972518 [Paxillus ammoniavirescens]
MSPKHTATSPFYAAVSETPTPTQPSTANEAIRLQTVFGIVLGLISFVLLIFSFSFLYRRCFPSKSMSRGSQQRARLGHASRRGPRGPHVDYPVAAASLRFEPTMNGAPPPYEGIRLPPYPEQSSPHTGQSSSLAEQNSELNSPPMARLEV